MRIGVIADTHGHLDPQVRDHFRGVDHILHAGDIGFASIILELEDIAPTTAVIGNNDEGMAYRERELVTLGDLRVMVQHIVPPGPPDAALRAQLWREGVGLLVFGHSHRRFAETYQDTHFFNPGYAGKPRLGLTRSAALLELAGGRVHRHRFLDL